MDVSPRDRSAQPQAVPELDAIRADDISKSRHRSTPTGRDHAEPDPCHAATNKAARKTNNRKDCPKSAVYSRLPHDDRGSGDHEQPR